jgi:hypothetical protein
VLAIWHHPTQPTLHVADGGAGTGIPNVYVLELVLPSRPVSKGATHA